MSLDDDTRPTLIGRLPSQRLRSMGEFLLNPSLARSIIALLAAAIVLLLVLNFSTFVLVQRTAMINQQVDQTWQFRRAARQVLLNIQKAETAQRGYLLTGQTAVLRTYETARMDHDRLIQELSILNGGDTASMVSVGSLRRLSTDKYAEMNLTLEAKRRGRNDDAVSLVSAGRGMRLMEEIDAELGRIDRQQGLQVSRLSVDAERSAIMAIAVNAAAGVLVLVLAWIVAVLVRRYLTDLNEAQSRLDVANMGLEDTVRARTAALVCANEEVQRFAYIVSHDLRSPLVNVMGYTAELEQAGRIIDRQMTRVETVKPDLVEGDAIVAVREDIPEAIGFIRASTEKMDRLINAILKLSREGRRNLVAEMLDMTTMVEKISDSVHHQTEAAAAQITVESLPHLENDRLSIEQIMGNLIDNAIKYLEPGRPGRIVISGRNLSDGWVEYAIADNGRGIAPRDHERIFDLFRRAGRQDQQGEGLGLAFVRNSVRRLGGDVSVESVLGEGSTFRLKFPKRLIVDDAGETL